MLGISSHAQGTLLFKNTLLFHPETQQPYDAPAYNAAGVPLASDFSASLYVANGASESLIAVTTFRNSRPGHLNQIPVEVPGVPPGQAATFRVKVWETAAGSYENAVQNGFCAGVFPTLSGNNEVTVVLGPFGPSPAQDALLNGLLPLTLDCIPEPATLTLFLVGAVLLMSRPFQIKDFKGAK